MHTWEVNIRVGRKQMLYEIHLDHVVDKWLGLVNGRSALGFYKMRGIC